MQIRLSIGEGAGIENKSPSFFYCSARRTIVRHPARPSIHLPSETGSRTQDSVALGSPRDLEYSYSSSSSGGREQAFPP